MSATRVNGLALAARTTAIVIAVVAAVDPSVSTPRRDRPQLSVVVADSARDDALFRSVVSQSQANFDVVPGALTSAAGTVYIGDRVPSHDAAQAMASPVVVVTPFSAGAHLELAHITAPARAAMESRIPISAQLHARGIASSQWARVQLRLGTRVVAGSRVALTRDGTVPVALSIAPTTAQPTVVTLVAFIENAARTAADTARHDVLVNVQSARRTVLFFDRRPSWMSTFVRRALERDPRFAVTSRIVTSMTSKTTVTRDAGRAPADLAALAANEPFDAVVTGAPDALTARDVDALRALLRDRGASVLLLADHAAAGPADALIGANGWRLQARRTPATLSASDTSQHLAAASIGISATLPADAQVIASLPDSGKRAVIWRQPIGLGTLVVSGAFDAWRYRDPAQSTFDATWRDLIDDAIARRLAPLELQLSSSIATPREPLTVSVTVREPSADSDFVAVVRPANDTITLHRTADGQFGGQRLAPATSGTYRVVVHRRTARGTDSVSAPLVVANRVSRDGDQDAELLSTWAASRGGTVVASEPLTSLADELTRRVAPPARLTPWHPMRSPWWIVPFALLLSVEWWQRRKHGAP